MSIPINKSLEALRTDLFARINTVQEDYVAKGWLPVTLNLNKGIARGLIELWAWGLYQLYSFLALVLKQAFPSTATGAWLDLHCQQVGLTRLEATKATGEIYFTRAEVSGNVPIAAGRVVRTKPDGAGQVYRFITTEDAVLPDGATEIAVPVEAEEYGAAANVVAGQIVEVVTTVPGVDAVENRSDWLSAEGTDRETDTKLRERYVLAWMGLGGVTTAAYESWARSVSGVVAVAIMDQHPRGQGTVDVVIRGAAGLPTAELITAVDVVVQGKRPINDDALVKAPTAVPVTIEAELVLLAGDPAAIAAEVEARLAAMFTDPSPVAAVAAVGIGEDLVRDRLVAEIMAVRGIKKINFTSPAGDVAVEDDGMVTLTSIAITTIWASEP